MSEFVETLYDLAQTNTPDPGDVLISIDGQPMAGVETVRHDGDLVTIVMRYESLRMVSRQLTGPSGIALEEL